MSLQAWYPFNGNLENLGLGDLDLTVQTPPTYTTGKVTGEGLAYGKFKWTAEQSAKVLNNKALSICFWLKPTQSTGTLDIFTQPYPIRKFCIFTYPTLNDLHLDFRYNDAGSYMTAHVSNGFFPTNTWTHCAITFEYPNIIKIYKNGILHATETGKGAMNISSFAYESYINNTINGRYINDFRIYDHCLSPKEVKEISKGLMLHYPLDNCGMGCKNYIKDSYYTNPFICAFNSSTLTKTAVEIDDEQFKGTFYKFTRGASGGGDFRLGWRSPDIQIDPDLYNDKKLCFSAWVKSTTGTSLKMWSARVSDQDYAELGSTTIPANKWTKVIFYRTFLSSSSAANIDKLELYFQISFNTDLIMAQAKLEIADEATPWCPNEADELYSQLGMDRNIEYDTSGYGNNAIKTSVNYNSGSPRYQTSTEFDGTTSGITLYPGTINSILTQGGSNPFTYSFWIKNAATDRGIIFGDHKEAVTPAFISIEKHLQNELRFYWKNEYIDWFCTNTTLSLNTWLHIAITYNGSKLSVYRNGILTDSKTITLTTGNKSSDNYFQIGRDTRTNNTMFEGNLSDFRIYATCLSDSDIQELYNKPISIDNQGTMFAVEAAEEPASPVKFNKTGVVEANQIGEYYHNYFDYDGPMTTEFLQKVSVEKLIENNGFKLTCTSAVTSYLVLHRMRNLMFNGANGDFKVEFDAWSTNPITIVCDICDKTFGTYNLTAERQHFSGVAQGVNGYNTSSSYNGFFDIASSSVALGTEIYITNIVITKNTPKSIGSNYIVMDDIIEN